MPAQVINGRKLAARIRAETLAGVEELGRSSLQVRLDAIIVGAPADGLLYAQAQQRRCLKAGIDYHLHTLGAETSNDELQAFIAELSANPDITGIMLNLPMPDHIDAPAAQYCIDPYKDIEGVNPANIGLLFYGTPIIAPCTALAVMTILEFAGIALSGTHAVVVGQGSIVGKPIASALMAADATVTTCNKFTPDLAAHTKQADVLIAAAGAAELIGAEHVRPGAVVIDVGINTVPGDDPGTTRVTGDVRFDEVIDIASVITPVPGGVGPVTVAKLLHSAVGAAAQQLAKRRLH